MQKRWRVLCVAIITVLFIAIPFLLYSYSENTTHPALTYEMVELFNLTYPELALSNEEREWVIKGSIDEDIYPRWIHHFYDPLHNSGWSAEEFGRFSSSTGRFLSKHILSDYPPVPAKYWAVMPLVQAQYAQFGGDRTWQRALYELSVNNNRFEALYTLGHVLHLLEDMTVPDHTRNDTHPHPLRLITGDIGSPYELFTKQFYRELGKTNIPHSAYYLFIRGYKPVILNTPSEYFDFLSNFSQRFFFSKDTVQSLKFPWPKIVFIDDQYGYSLDPFGIIFPTARHRLIRLPDFSFSHTLSLEDPVGDREILQGYFDRLSTQAIRYGAGLIKLFFDEAEKNAVTSIPVEKPGVNSVYQKIITVKDTVQKIADNLVQDKQLIISSTAKQQVLGVTIASTNTFSVVTTTFVATSSEQLVYLQPIPREVIYPIHNNEEDQVAVSIAPIDPVPQNLTPRSTAIPVATLTNSSTEPVIITSTLIIPPDQSDSASGVTSSSITSTIATTTTTTTTTTLPFLEPLRPSIVINEIAWAGTSETTPFDEWIELYNFGDEIVDISKYKMRIGDKFLSFQIKNAFIGPKQYMLLERRRNETVREIEADVIYNDAIINNNGDVITLFDENDIIIDEVEFLNGWPIENQNYRTLERVSTIVSSTEVSNWQQNKGFRMAGRSFNGGAIYGSPKQSNFGAIALNFRQEEDVRVLKKEDNPYYLGYYEIPSGKRLVIEPGVVIKSFYNDSKIDVFGELIVAGSENEPVILTSGKENPAPQDWQGIWLHANSVGNLKNLHMSYAGKPFRVDNFLYTGFISQGIRADSSIVHFDNVLLDKNGETAYYAFQSTSTIEHSIFNGGDKAIDVWYGSAKLENVALNSFTSLISPIQFHYTWPELEDLEFSETTIDGPVIEMADIVNQQVIDAHWPVYLNNIRILSEGSLDLKPGAQLVMAKNGIIEIFGTFLSEGFAESKVVIKPRNSSELWGSLRFKEGGKGSIRYTNILGGNSNFPMPRDIAGMLILDKDSEVSIEQSNLLNADSDGNTVYTTDANLKISDSLIGQSEPQGRDITGLRIGSGSVNLNNATFQNVRYGIRGNSLPLPTILVQNMTEENFIGVEYPYEAVDTGNVQINVTN